MLRMVKKIHNTVKIDYRNGLIEDSLLYINPHRISPILKLVRAWSIKIKPQESIKIVKLVKTLSEIDPVKLNHVKRMQKFEPSLLTVILCSELLMGKSEVMLKLHEIGIEYDNLVIREVPDHIPPTKDLSNDWSSTFWPLLWKGNPTDQILNEMTFDMSKIRNHLNDIVDYETSALPAVTCIVDPITDEVLTINEDKRHEHPLHHSIMKSIEMVSQLESQRRKTREAHYLCNDYHVYTTHEPCTMCCMALIHSRVARLIYIRQSSGTGGLDPASSEGYSIHDHKILNSKFEVFQWIGEGFDDKVANIDDHVSI